MIVRVVAVVASSEYVRDTYIYSNSRRPRSLKAAIGEGFLTFFPVLGAK